MLGKLAKWLKILGLDTLFSPNLKDDELLVLARREKRVLLTRDNGLIERAKDIRSLFIDSEDWVEQLEQVLSRFKLWQKTKPYSRCIECNIPLKELPRERARNLAAPFVYAKNPEFSLCPDCGRIFWKGSHRKDMDLRLKKILSDK